MWSPFQCTTAPGTAQRSTGVGVWGDSNRWPCRSGRLGDFRGHAGQCGSINTLGPGLSAQPGPNKGGRRSCCALPGLFPFVFYLFSCPPTGKLCSWGWLMPAWRSFGRNVCRLVGGQPASWRQWVEPTAGLLRVAPLV